MYRLNSERVGNMGGGEMVFGQRMVATDNQMLNDKNLGNFVIPDSCKNLERNV